MSRGSRAIQRNRRTHLLLDAIKVQGAKLLALEDDPIAVMRLLCHGTPFQAQGLQSPTPAQDVADERERVFGQGAVCEDQGAEVGQRRGDGRGDGADGIGRKEDVLQATEEGKVGEGGDAVVGEVERVERIARDSQVLNGGDFVPYWDGAE